MARWQVVHLNELTRGKHAEGVVGWASKARADDGDVALVEPGMEMRSHFR